MSENTYLEQYLNQVILPLYLHDWLMEALKEMKGKKNARQLKKVHELIDRVEKSGKKLALYQKVFLELMVTDYKYNLKNVHELIDRVEKSGKKLALYQKIFLELMVTDDKYNLKKI